MMMYRSDGTAAFVGLERITGRIAGRNGSFVLQRTGVFEDGPGQGILFLSVALFVASQPPKRGRLLSTSDMVQMETTQIPRRGLAHAVRGIG